MRKTILLAIIACVLGIVLLAALAFYIPNRLGQTSRDGQSEVFTGFQFSTEETKKAASALPESGKQAAPALPESGKQTAPARQESESQTAPSLQKPEGSGAASQETEATESLPRDTLPSRDGHRLAGLSEETERMSEALASFSTLPSQVKDHRIIWAGDSRTLGLGNALHKSDRVDDDLFVGKVGEGVRWFREEGMAELSDVIDQNPSLPVVLNFGVNDPQLVDEYVVAYWDVIRAHPDTKFYILSVNPLDEEFLISDGQVSESVFDSVNSLNVARLNVKLKSEFGSRYIDSASFLKADGFETVDGLHFSTKTYLKIHDYVVGKLF